MININRISKLIFLLVIVFSSCITEEIERQMLVSTGSAIEIQATKANLPGEIIDFGEGVDQYGHCWSTNPVPTINDSISVVNENVDGRYLSSISGLDDETVYFYRSYAKNEDNVVYGPEISFQTISYGIPTAKFKSLNVSKSSITLEIELTDLGGYDPKSYGICWSKNPDPTIESNIIDFGAFSNFESKEITINNLDSVTAYYFNVFVSNEKDVGYTNDFLVQTYGNANVSYGLIHYYIFNGSTNDFSGNNNHAINHGAELTADRFGNPNSAYSFDGLSDYMVLTNTLDASEGLTFSFWVKTTGVQTGENTGGVICKYNYNSDYRCFSISTWSGTNRCLRGNFYALGTNTDLRDCAWSDMMTVADIPSQWDASKFELVNPMILPFDIWAYCVVNVTDTEVQTWINGVLSVKKEREYSSYFNTNAEPTYIGNNFASGAGDSYHFYGSLDDLRVYDRALSEEEIQLLYHEGGWDN